MMRKWCITTLVVCALVVAVLAAQMWFNREGTFSYVNYERIHVGMTLSDVERLIGRPGTETTEYFLPSVQDASVPGRPNRNKKVVAGDRYFFWGHGDGSGEAIYISLRGDVVAEKWFRNYSF